MFVWLGIIFCISQSALFSGLNLAVFSVSRLRLEVKVSSGNKDAARVLKLREDANFLLTTILWGNVGINVLLTLLSNSLLAGVSAFFFSTFIITFAGEILPQGYFSRNALRMASLLYPIIRFYQYLLYPLAKPSALMLNWMVGQESIHYFKEKSLAKLIRRHIDEEGECLNPDSIVPLEHQNGKPIFPECSTEKENTFLKKINKSGKKWVVIVDWQHNPSWVMKNRSLPGRIFSEDY